MTKEQSKNIQSLEPYIEDLTEILGATANTYRLQILINLNKSIQDFSELLSITKLSKTALAHHMEKLIAASLIENISRGKYRLTNNGFELLDGIANAFINSNLKKEKETAKKLELFQKAYSKDTQKEDFLSVKFERLLPMRIVSFHAISESPERDAWKKLREWAEPKGFLNDFDEHPIFGFNNPNPKPGEKKYGYEFWLKVSSNFKTSDDILVKDIPEYLYAVTTCFNLENIGRDWKNLVDWVMKKRYTIRYDINCLEKHNPNSTIENLILDLYLPIEEEK
ncbi:MAG: effector binding domain-containing protein [Candidatus Thorarchaeota archaeon]